MRTVIKEKGEPTPNRVQSSSLELPRCEGGKDHEVGLNEKGERRNSRADRNKGERRKEKGERRNSRADCKDRSKGEITVQTARTVVKEKGARTMRTARSVVKEKGERTVRPLRQLFLLSHFSFLISPFSFLLSPFSSILVPHAYVPSGPKSPCAYA